MVKKAIFALISLLVSQAGYCLDTPPGSLFPWTVSKTVENAMMRTGTVSANSAELSTTLQGISTALTEAEAGSGALAGGLTAEGLLTGSCIVAGIAPTLVIAGVTIAAGYAGDALVKMYKNSDGTYTVEHAGQQPSGDSSEPGFSVGNQIYKIQYSNVETGSIGNVPKYWESTENASYASSSTPYYKIQNTTNCSIIDNGVYCDYDLVNNYDPANPRTQHLRNSVALLQPADYSCPAGDYYDGTQCSGGVSTAPYSPYSLTPVTYPNAKAAIASLSSSELALQVDPQVTAQTATAVMNSLQTDPNYRGKATPSISPSDVPTSPALTVRDMTQNITNTDIQNITNNTYNNTTNNQTSPTATQVSPDTPAASQVKVDLGQDPGTPAPNLDTPPDGPTILAPITSMMPDLKNWKMPSHTSVCPQPSFDVFGHSFTFSTHCTLIDANKGILQAAATVAWTVLALFIVLGA